MIEKYKFEINYIKSLKKNKTRQLIYITYKDNYKKQRIKIYNINKLLNN